MLPLTEIVANLARLGVTGDAEAVRAYVRRVVRQTEGVPELTALRLQLGKLLVAPVPAAMRGARAPVDSTSFHALLRVEDAAASELPLLEPDVRAALEQVLEEHRQVAKLAAAGIEPTRSVLLVGPPGVGKTMTARYLARSLDLPLLTLDLAAVMSSLLGRTGQNLRSVLDHARSTPCILFLDEFDALAKRRDDPSDIGELKRIVNVLLVEIERWPAHGILVAATNHPEILDRAVERRFGRIISLPLPSTELRRDLLIATLGEEWARSDAPLLAYAVAATHGRPSSSVVALANNARRSALLSPDTSLTTELLRHLRRLSPGAEVRDGEARSDALIPVVRALVRDAKLSYREAGALLDVSHMTVARIARRMKDASRQGAKGTEPSTSALAKKGASAKREATATKTRSGDAKRRVAR